MSKEGRAAQNNPKRFVNKQNSGGGPEQPIAPYEHGKAPAEQSQSASWNAKAAWRENI